MVGGITAAGLLVFLGYVPSDLVYRISSPPTPSKVTFRGYPVVRYGEFRLGDVAYGDGRDRNTRIVSGPYFVEYIVDGRTERHIGIGFNRTTYHIPGSRPVRVSHSVLR